jgi:LmbE family N-acetylglucosaminyl deacetylase
MKILAIGSHLDDIELACGGTLAQAIKNGHEVKCLVMTESDYKNFDGKVLRTERQATTEGLDAMRILNIKHLTILEFPVKNIPYDGSTVEAIDREITEFKPDLIFTHWIHDTHQDHRNTGLATISAGRRYNNILMYEPFPPSGRSYEAFRPQVYSDITNTLQVKIDALVAHKSQYAKYGEEWIEATKGRAKLRGYESGHSYAECFEIVRMDLCI